MEPPSLTKAQTEVIRWIRKIRQERKKKMSDQITSYIRTLSPYVVGAVVSFLATKGLNVPPDLQEATTALLTVVLGTLYYVIVRKLEQKWPKLGILLGIAKAPEYKS